MKTALLTFSILLIGMSLNDQSASALLERHGSALKDAKSFTIKLSIQPIGGATAQETITLAPGGRFKIESADGFVVSDGKTVWSYNKARNSYTEAPWSAQAAREIALRTDLWAWSAYLDEAVLKEASGLKVGAKRKIKGQEVVELALITKGEPDVSGTLYLSPVSGMAIGALIKGAQPSDPETLVIATEIATASEVPESTFSFEAPVGSTKFDPNASPSPESVTYRQVHSVWMSKCMPCHNSSNRKGGLDLTAYRSVMGEEGAVIPGDPDNSVVVMYVEGRLAPRMPKGKAPLSKFEIGTIRSWIKAGAKDGE